MANPDHLARLLAGGPYWNSWCAAGDLSEVDLRGAELAGVDLRGADLWYAKLHGADLGAARLEGAVLTRADPSGAALVEADLTLAKVTEAAVEAANFFGSDVASAHGLERGSGWIQDERGVPRWEAPGVGLDRRGLMLEGLRRAGGA